MTQYVNQFELGKEVGQLDLRLNSNIIQCRSNGTLIAGQVVKLVDTAAGIPVVDVAADTDVPFGFVCYNHKETSYSAGDMIEIALSGSYMYMQAGAAITPGAEIMYVYASANVITASGTSNKYVSGYALDKATTSADIIRVAIKTFGDAKRPSA